MQPGDFILCQNVTQLAAVSGACLSQTITRLGGNMNFSNDPRIRRYMRQMRGCAAVVATNRHLYKIASAANPATYLIPNGIDLAAWRPDPCRSFRAGRPVVGFCGNISSPAKRAYKGYDLVFQAACELGLEMRAALYGEGQIPHQEMKSRFFDEIDIFVLPTDGEGCSNSIMEALACGVPVVTTRQAGYHGEMLTDGLDVVFIEEKTASSVSRALSRFIGNPALFHRLSRAGRRFAEHYHDIDQVADQYRAVFERHFKKPDPAALRAFYCTACTRLFAQKGEDPPCKGCSYNGGLK
jgi:glycosyltransferase involved in cell wall biosynthesis